MSLLLYKDVYDENGEPEFSEQVIDELQQLSQIVCSNHFGYVSYHDREDLIMEGQRKGIELIQSCRFDPSYGSQLKNFVYTGMRNEMTNYLYSKKREYPVEEFYGDQKESEDIVLDNYEVDYCDLKCIIDKFKTRYGDISGWVVDELEDMGFTIVGDYNKKYERKMSDLIEKVVVICVWKIREFYL